MFCKKDRKKLKKLRLGPTFKKIVIFCVCPFKLYIIFVCLSSVFLFVCFPLLSTFHFYSLLLSAKLFLSLCLSVYSLFSNFGIKQLECLHVKMKIVFFWPEISAANFVGQTSKERERERQEVFPMGSMSSWLVQPFVLYFMNGQKNNSNLLHRKLAKTNLMNFSQIPP